MPLKAVVLILVLMEDALVHEEENNRLVIYF